MRAWLTLLAATFAAGFYLPGVAPVQYPDGATVDIKVNKITSTETQLPYQFYDLPFCQPAGGIQDVTENLGEILSGDRIHNSAYQLKFKEEVKCAVLCVLDYDHEAIDEFSERIREEYRIHWILDNLPAATHETLVMDDGSERESFEDGFPIGYVGDPGVWAGSVAGKIYLFNHYVIKVKYHDDPAFTGSRIVGFEVQPYSIKHSSDQGCDATPTVERVRLDETQHVVWTYDVQWEWSSIRWASRWDTYLLMNDPQIHWFSIINSLVIVLFLSGMVAMIMMRTLHQDFRRYSDLRTQEEVQEETGWKLVHADVFRPPSCVLVLSIFTGSGVQVLCMAVVILVFALLGFLSPANRGGLVTATLVMFVLMGVFAGYSGARTYKMLGGQAWKRMTMLIAFVLPGIMFLIFVIMNFVVLSQHMANGVHSSGAVPFSAMAALMGLWFGVSIPLVFMGSYFGNRKPAIEPPPGLRVNQIPRQIPPQVWYMRTPIAVLVAGILPFGAVFIELFFILSSIWLNQFYYIFGFLFIVFLILVLTCAEITIVMCYFQLCGEDYHWWWRSFLAAGSSAVYLFLYSIFYFFTKLHIHKFATGVLFFGYMSLLSFAFFLMTGAVGLYSCLWFVRKIYGSIKVD